MMNTAKTGISKKASVKTTPVTLRHQQHLKEIALIKVAAFETGHTKKSIIAALRENGLSGNAANVEHVQALRDKFNSVRRNRCLHRVNARISQPIQALPIPTGRPAILMPTASRTEKLTAIRKRAVTTQAKGAFRYGAPGGTSFAITFANNTSEVGYRVDLGTDWNVYRGRFKGWSANVDCHKICVPIDWRLRVERRELAILGGMLTLDALPMEAPPGIELYAAVWACQGRGYHVKTERGYIAVGGGEHFHSDTSENAVAGLLRKCKIAKSNVGLLADFVSSVNAFVEKYSTYKIDVSLDDARDSGSCEYGIRSWCESVGIDINRIHVPMMELLDAFRCMPLTEVRRAVLHAVRSSRTHN